MTNNELAIDWIRLTNENWLLKLELARNRVSLVVTAIALGLTTLVLIWCLLR